MCVVQICVLCAKDPSLRTCTVVSWLPPMSKNNKTPSAGNKLAQGATGSLDKYSVL